MPYVYREIHTRHGVAPSVLLWVVIVTLPVCVGFDRATFFFQSFGPCTNSFLMHVFRCLFNL